MRCYLVRHAQTLRNQPLRFQGRTDTLLSPFGLTQAQCLGASFTGQTPGAIYSSPLQRCVQTANAIASTTGAVVRIEPGLAEMDFGAWEGLTTADVERQFTRTYHEWLKAPSQVRIPDGEPCDQFRIRVREAFVNIATRHHEEGCQELLIVSHGGVIASLLADWLGADFDHLIRHVVLDNGGISVVEWRANSSSVLWINATIHLSQQIPHGAHWRGI